MAITKIKGKGFLSPLPLKGTTEILRKKESPNLYSEGINGDLLDILPAFLGS